MAAWYLPKSRGISTRDVLCFGEGRKPSAPAAVQQHAVGRRRNLVCRFLVWMHRHLSGLFIRQTLESFHGYWQKRVEARARAKPTEVLSLMQGSMKFEWGEKRVFAKWPTISAEALFNSESLRSAGRSPAVDFWTGRGRKLRGNREHKLL